MSIYNQPLYYEIAFGFVEPEKQADLIMEFISEYSMIKVKRVLDLGCGPSVQLRQLAKRGYHCIGLDLSQSMLDYLHDRSIKEKINIELVKADFTDFKLEKKVDFMLMMMGTIGLIESNDQMLKHLDSAAHALKKGGLYLIEDFRLDWNGELFGPVKWTMERNGITVRTKYDIELEDALTQMMIESIIIEVEYHGQIRKFYEKRRTKLIFPEEFITLVKYNGKFEFLGWFERESSKRLEKPDLDNIVLLRKR